MKQKTKEISKTLIIEFTPLIIWASIIMSLTLYEVTVILPFIIKYNLFVKDIAFIPCYITLFLYMPFRVSKYFDLKTKEIIRWYFNNVQEKTNTTQNKTKL